MRARLACTAALVDSRLKKDDVVYRVVQYKNACVRRIPYEATLFREYVRMSSRIRPQTFGSPRLLLSVLHMASGSQHARVVVVQANPKKNAVKAQQYGIRSNIGVSPRRLSAGLWLCNPGVRQGCGSSTPAPVCFNTCLNQCLTNR